MIEFLLNDELITIEEERADLTLLDFLRDHRSLCGTKEGCASGDCGACTVVIADPGNGIPEYRNCNSCITFLGALHGRQLFTVEHLSQSGTLHPVQQAMVDQHGSQCGFCTPGFIMSMFSMYKSTGANGEPPDRETIDEYLGGNLCRCTGYRPIIDASIKSLGSAPDDPFNDGAEEVNRRLLQIMTSNPAGTGNFMIPRSCRELAQLMGAHPLARLLGGGTDLALEVTQQLKNIEEIIYLGQVKELLAIENGSEYFSFGASVSLHDFRETVRGTYPDLDELMLRFGSRQVRNLGTVGGNIANASPIGDLPPVILALDAELELQSASGVRRIAADDFFLDYRVTALQKGEFLRSVQLPKRNGNHSLKAYKVSKRLDDDISAVCGVFDMEMEERTVKSIRAAFGGMAAVPKRAINLEQSLIGQILDDQVVARAQDAVEQDFEPIDDVRASATYRTQVARNLIKRLQYELTSPHVETRVTAYAN